MLNLLVFSSRWGHCGHMGILVAQADNCILLQPVHSFGTCMQETSILLALPCDHMEVSQQEIDRDRPSLADFTQEKSLEKSLGSL